MDKFYNETYLKLETAIQELEIETDCSLQRIEAAIQLILQSLLDLKEFVLKSDFKNVEEEINFFKYQKPAIVSKLIYYNSIYKIETRRPYGNKHTKKYFTKELKKLKRFFENNLDFYKYYRSQNSFVDEKFLYVASTTYGYGWTLSILRQTTAFPLPTIIRLPR
jgi:RteC protein.